MPILTKQDVSRSQVTSDLSSPLYLPKLEQCTSRKESCIDLVHRLIPIDEKSDKDRHISNFIQKFNNDLEIKRRKKLRKKFMLNFDGQQLQEMIE